MLLLALCSKSITEGKQQVVPEQRLERRESAVETPTESGEWDTRSFISLTQNFLVKSGAKVTRQQLCFYLELIGEYNRWSPEEWTLETGFKNFSQKNGETARRIADIQISFWIIRALIGAAIQETPLRGNTPNM